MKTQLTTLDNASRTCEMTEPVSGGQPILALLTRLLWATALALPVFGAQAAVVFTNLHSFSGDDGANPQAGLVQSSDGYLYGTTYSGGTIGFGTVFKISTNGALTSLYSFGSVQDTDGLPLDGANPWAGLVQGSDGNFYGTTTDEQVLAYGTVFRICTNGALTTLHSFTGTNDGGPPYARLVLGSDGGFYGTTAWGGTNGFGTVFRISTNGALTTLHSFINFNGIHPNGLVQGSDGHFYGTTSSDGVFQEPFGCGTVFKISTNGALTRLCSFSGNDGCGPQAGLLQGSDGSFYGTTEYGGTNDCGTVFKISTNGVLTSLYSFTGNEGASPFAGLVQGSDGSFYGTTEYGGGAYTNQYGQGYGTLFKISTTGALTSLYSFTGGNDGANPYAGLVQGSDGSFYGTTEYGGTNHAGTVFRLTVLPSEPELTIGRSGTNVILAWPTNYPGCTLQSTTNLGSSAAWSTNSPAPVVVNGQYTVTNPISGSRQFYRLSSP